MLTQMIRPIIKNIYKLQKNRKGTQVLSKQKIGVMVAGPTKDNPNEITFGFSLCNPLDKYDWITNHKQNNSSMPIKNFGRNLAVKRAIKWANNKTSPFIPYKIRTEVNNFIIRAEKYYKDRTIPIWLKNIQTDSV